ncbi:glycoside hydrolase superfamily [Aspergillus spinulosporus]
MPAAQPFDNPLGLNEVYTVASPLIASCPSTNQALPVKAFPALTVSLMTPVMPGQMVQVTAEGVDSASMTEVYAAFITVTRPVWASAAAQGNNTFTILARLKKALAEYKFGLSITLPTSYWYLQYFDLEAIDPSVDWFNFMSYDLHGTLDIGNKWTGAYLNTHTNLTDITTALDLLWRNGFKPSKVNMGMVFYGRSFTLASSSCTKPGCPYLSAGDAGVCSDTAGVLFNSEIETIIIDNDLTPELYKDGAVKTALGPNADYGQLLNDFGVWLHEQGTFSIDNRVYLWPSLRDIAVDDGFTPNINARTRLNPQDGAFDENWRPDGDAPTDPSYHRNT